MGVRASAACGGVGFAVVAFVTETLTMQAMDRFLLWFVGDDLSIQDGHTFF